MDTNQEHQIYRVITRGIRVQRGPGNADLVVERPRRDHTDGSYEFLDSDENPTLVAFDHLCRCDVRSMVAIGALAPWDGPIDGVTIQGFVPIEELHAREVSSADGPVDGDGSATAGSDA